MNKCTRCGKEQNTPGICSECFRANLEKEIQERRDQCLAEGEVYRRNFFDLIEDKIMNIQHMIDLADRNEDFPASYCDVMRILIDDLKRSLKEDHDFIRSHLGKVEIVKARGHNSHCLEYGERLALDFEPTDETIEKLKSSGFLASEGAGDNQAQSD